MLPPATEKVWTFLKNQPALGGFVLIGGSALALRIRHRLSEDLDLIILEPRLPRARLEALRRLAADAGFNFKPNDDEAALHEFAESALELHDYQQDFVVNDSVKVSFFAPDEALRKVMSAHGASTVEIATLPELFKAKCLVSAQRSKTRDWIDLYLLMRDHGFSVADYSAAFVEGGVPNQRDIGLARLAGGTPQGDDEGFAHLLDSPPSLEEMKSFFVEQRRKLEIEASAEAARRKSKK